MLAAPALTFVLGLMVNSHARKKLASPARANRLSGLAALLTFPAMVVSGYVLQISTSATLTRASLILHLASSGVFALTYVIHQVVSIRLSRTAAAPQKAASFVRQQTA